MDVVTIQTAELTDRQFRQISELVRNQCGINLHEGKRELVKARLGKRLRELGLSGYDDYVEYVRRDASGDELVAMLDSISTNLTFFFRERGHFDFLAREVLPRIVAKGSARKRRLRIWSAGCSSGEEPYSIAILLHEEIPALASWDARILATDLSTRVLSIARTGVYDGERLRDVSPAMVARYFDCVQSTPPRHYRLKEPVRRIVTFSRLNLVGTWPMRGPFDAIFCRNVMIYFEKSTQAALVDRYWQLLAPGGVLFMGHSESLAGVKHRFEYVEPTVYRKG
jgi:chemotaxis protein methyltransferase CheR